MVMQMVSCGKVQVSIGGNSLQLLSGKSTGFRVYMQQFCFEVCCRHTKNVRKNFKDCPDAFRNHSIYEVPLYFDIRHRYDFQSIVYFALWDSGCVDG